MPELFLAVRETLFFVSHSSSGLATSMNVSVAYSIPRFRELTESMNVQLQGKIDLLKELRAFVAKHKDGTLSTSSFEEVPALLRTEK